MPRKPSTESDNEKAQRSRVTSAERSRAWRERNPAIGALVTVPDECRRRVCPECAEAERLRGLRRRRDQERRDWGQFPWERPEDKPLPWSDDQAATYEGLLSERGWLQHQLGAFGIEQLCRRHSG